MRAHKIQKYAQKQKDRGGKRKKKRKNKERKERKKNKKKTERKGEIKEGNTQTKSNLKKKTFKSIRFLSNSIKFAICLLIHKLCSLQHLKHFKCN